MKSQIHDDWERLGISDFDLDIAAGKVCVFDQDTQRWRTYKLAYVYKQLIHRAYEDGRKDRLPFQRSA